MSTFRLTTIEEFEAATQRLLETGAKVGADSWQARVKNQTPHCKFGEEGICCRICTYGTLPYYKEAPRGICGCDAHGIAEETSFALLPAEPHPFLITEERSVILFTPLPPDGNY